MFGNGPICIIVAVIKFHGSVAKKVFLTMWYLVLVSFPYLQPAWANNLRITNLSLEDRDQTSSKIVAEFDITWDNSWRNEINHDAVWIFFTIFVDGDNLYEPIDLQSNTGIDPIDTSTGSNPDLEIYVVSNADGAFIRRAGTGSGTVIAKNVRLPLDYTTVPPAGIADSASVEIKIHGIEMVYIPEGPFYAGDGTSDSFFSTGPITTGAWYISDDEALTTTTSCCYYYTEPSTGSGHNTGSVFTINADYPLGYNAFYAMKYEISEGQYVEFLNELDSTMLTSRNPVTSSSGGKNSASVDFRNTLSGTSVQSISTLRSDRAMNYLSWMDMAAYLWWAKLRPLSELEYEKAARGPITVVPGEFAWGSTSITSDIALSISPEDGTEELSNVNANIAYNGGFNVYTHGDTIFTTGHQQGPLRVGIFADGAAGDREKAGAGYFGVMELSSNLNERVMTVGKSEASSFFNGENSDHGDGDLMSVGNAKNGHGWCGLAVACNINVGAGLRGTDWNSSSSRARISDRELAIQTTNNRSNTRGGRGARTCSNCLE